MLSLRLAYTLLILQHELSTKVLLSLRDNIQDVLSTGFYCDDRCNDDVTQLVSSMHCTIKWSHKQRFVKWTERHPNVQEEEELSQLCQYCGNPWIFPSIGCHLNEQIGSWQQEIDDESYSKDLKLFTTSVLQRCWRHPRSMGEHGSQLSHTVIASIQ